MIAHRPEGLLLLLLVPVLLLLRRRALRPREFAASSLLIWKRIAATAPVPPDHPRPPPSAWWEAAGVSLLALAAADLHLSTENARPVVVVLDTSPSMGARSAEGETRLQFARRAIAASGRPVEVFETEEPFHLARSREIAGAGVLVVVTDAPAELRDPPFALVSVGSEVRNAGITSVRGDIGDDGVARLHFVIEAAGPPGAWSGTLLREGGGPETVLVAPGRPATVVHTLDATSPTDPWTFRIEFPGDALPADDVVAVRRAGGATVEARPGGAASADLLRALLATGRATLPDLPGESGDGDVLVRLSRPATSRSSGGPASLVMRRVPRASGATPGAVVAAGDLLATDDPLVSGVHPDPILVAGRRVSDGAAAPGVPLLVDGSGPLVSVERASPEEWTVHLALEPDAEWTARDPAFVVFIANLVDAVAGGPSRVEVQGVLNSAETLCSSTPSGSIEAALAATSGVDSRGAGLGPWLLLGAAAMLSVAAVSRP